MQLILFVLSLVWPVLIIALFIFFTVKVFYIDEHIREWIKDRERKQQLIFERNEVAAVLENIEKERPIATMTAVERADLLDLFAKKYPVWYAIYGEKMYMIPRSSQ